MAPEKGKRDIMTVERNGDVLVIGDSPQLVVNLRTQEHYILAGMKKFPYKKSVRFSEDLLKGERREVFRTAVRYHYENACGIVQGMIKAEEFRERANFVLREKGKIED